MKEKLRRKVFNGGQKHKYLTWGNNTILAVMNDPTWISGGLNGLNGKKDKRKI